jgi:hypothetical protein
MKDAFSEQPAWPAPAVQTRRAWRAQPLALLEAMHNLADWLAPESSVPNKLALQRAIDSHLLTARAALSSDQPFYVLSRNKASRSLALEHLHAAEADVLRLAPLNFIEGNMPSFLQRARTTFSPGDSRLIRLEDLAKKAEGGSITEQDKTSIISCVEGANAELQRSDSRVQSFVDFIMATSVILAILAITLGLIGWRSPTLFPVCFTSTSEGKLSLVCPTGSAVVPDPSNVPPDALGVDTETIAARTVKRLDVAFIELFGLMGAATSTAQAVRAGYNRTDSYRMSIALSILKLSTGAVIALLGIILIRAGLVPGIETFDSRSEIIAWSIVLGYSQQLFTGIVDRRAQSVLTETTAPATDQQRRLQ